MRIASVASDVSTFDYNYQSIKNALRELGADFKDGPKEFILPCIFNMECTTGKKPRSLYLNHQLKPGVFHCFKCGAKGNFDAFILQFTGWGSLRVLSFLRKHRACPIDVDDDTRVFSNAQAVTDAYLQNFSYRHAYCYDRKLEESTLRRFKIGYDPDENDIIIPWYDRVGKLGAIKRRAVAVKYYRFETDKDIRHLLFGLHLVRPRSVVFITEGEFDAMYLSQCFGKLHAPLFASVALGGKYLSPLAEAELLKKSPITIVLALDNDDDGAKAADDIYSRLRDHVVCLYMQYPSGVKDPNEMSLEQVIVSKDNVQNRSDYLHSLNAQRAEKSQHARS